MTLLQVLGTLLTHPLNQARKLHAVRDFLRWQIGTRILKMPVIVNFTERTILCVSRGMAGATGNVYCGLFEFEHMSFVLHFLRETDTFVDVGANVGAYTVLAAGECMARCVSFEPIESSFASLKTNVAINELQDRVTAHRVAVGCDSGELRMTNGLDAKNHVLVGSHDGEVVRVVTLDECIAIGSPTFIKIDVEGYEGSVVKGARKLLSSEQTRGVIVELCGHGEKYGSDAASVFSFLLSLNYKPFSYDPRTRSLGELNLEQVLTRRGNCLFLRPSDDLHSRLKTARPIRLPRHGQVD